MLHSCWRHAAAHWNLVHWLLSLIFPKAWIFIGEQPAVRFMLIVVGSGVLSPAPSVQSMSCWNPIFMAACALASLQHSPIEVFVPQTLASPLKFIFTELIFISVIIIILRRVWAVTTPSYHEVVFTITLALRESWVRFLAAYSTIVIGELVVNLENIIFLVGFFEARILMTSSLLIVKALHTLKTCLSPFVLFL